MSSVTSLGQSAKCSIQETSQRLGEDESDTDWEIDKLDGDSQHLDGWTDE